MSAPSRPPSPPPPNRELPDSPDQRGGRWIILCRVIDNFGDAGVCWRLARQLAREFGRAVTLYIDRPELVARLAGQQGRCEGVELREWPLEQAAGQASVERQAGQLPIGVAEDGSRRDDRFEPAPDVIVSAFGAEPPASMRALLAGAPARPLWINLEYLSAEPWVDGCHGLASVKPDDGAVEHFFYPGFTAASGGLLRERDAVADEACGSVKARSALLRRLGLPELEPGERLFTLFCYPDAPLEDWLPMLAASARPTLLLVPEGVAVNALARFAGATPRPGDPPIRHGWLRLAAIPFLAQDDYDALLRVADLNIVRGEDSWLRAHWARRPFIWQPYRQNDGAHFVKLDAFLEKFRAGARARQGDALYETALKQAFETVASLMTAWSGSGGTAALTRAWQEFEASEAPAGPAHLPPTALAFRLWTDHLLEQNDLASNLVSWVARKL